MATLLYRMAELGVDMHQLETARAAYSRSLDLALEVGDRQRLAFIFEGLAGVAATEQQPRRAMTLAGAATALRAAILTPLPAVEAERLEARLRPVRAMLGRQTGRWFARGQQLSVHDAVVYARSASDGPEQDALRAHAKQLSSREREVAALLAEGLSNRAIGARLGIARATVDRHVTHILTKLGLESRLQVALWIAHAA
jgi:DNA-binding CsgD family transcriptional regulator